MDETDHNFLHCTMVDILDLVKLESNEISSSVALIAHIKFQLNSTNGSEGDVENVKGHGRQQTYHGQQVIP